MLPFLSSTVLHCTSRAHELWSTPQTICAKSTSRMVWYRMQECMGCFEEHCLICINKLQHESPTSNYCVEKVVWQQKLQEDLCEMAPRSFWRQYDQRQNQKCNMSRVEGLFSNFPQSSGGSTSCLSRSLQNKSVDRPQSPTRDLKPQSCQTASEPPTGFFNVAIKHEDVTAALCVSQRVKLLVLWHLGQSSSWMFLRCCWTRLRRRFNQVSNKGAPRNFQGWKSR